MQKLLISATTFEVQPFLTENDFKQIEKNQFQKGDSTVLITGIGLMETAFQLTSFLTEKKVDFVLQAGVAGAYNNGLELGQLVEVTSEQYGDMGAEDHKNFLSTSQIPLPMPSIFKEDKIQNQQHYPSLQAVSAISVNTTAGNTRTIANRELLFNAEIETMEGLALFRIAKALNIPFSQVRTISNYVEPRNKANWKMQLAIKQLNEFLVQEF